MVLEENGNTIYEAIAEVQYLATFAKYNVGLATAAWSKESDYLYSAINMYTNCGKYGNVGENLIDTVSSDNSKVCSFAATDSSSNGSLNIILTNNNINENININIELKKNNKKYKKATIYGITSESSEIVEIDSSKLNKINDNKYTIEMPPVSAYRIILEK